MTTTARLANAGEGPRYEMTDGCHVLKAGVDGADPGFQVFEIEASRGPAAPAHVSPWHGVLYLLDGALRVEVAGTSHHITAGATVTIPAGVPTTFEVTSTAARFLAITSGGGAGRFFADFARSVPVDRPVAEQMPDILAVTRRHGVALATPVR